MIKNLLYALALITLSHSAFSQNNIQLNIHHNLGDLDFSFGEATTNNIGHDIKYTRLEYYISEISIIHDGGTETSIDDLWILVNAGTPTSVELGSYDITNVEQVKLHIGVDEAHNHLDPSSYESSHPLAPKNPSMHWGWSPGYRFIALEGVAGSDYNQPVQLHGLGDGNYHEVVIDNDAVAYAGECVIDIYADYNRALENIEINSGVIVHAENAEARVMIENFRDYVFSASGTAASIDEINQNDYFSIYPNPVEGGNITLTSKRESNQDYMITITDILGKEVLTVRSSNQKEVLKTEALKSGYYFVNLLQKGRLIQSKKLVIK